MKKIGLLAGALSIACCGAASAADLPQAAMPVKAPVVAPLPYNWSGFYVGGNLGYGWSSQCIDITAINATAVAFAEGCKSAGGGLVGGQGGYRWQSGQFVFGAELSGDWANIRNSRASINPNFAGDTWKSTLDGLGLITGQLGFAADNVLFYFKGGAAVGSQNFGIYNTATGTGIAFAERTRWGGVVGAGIDYGITQNWTVGLEWDYLFRSSDSTIWSTPALAPAVTTVATSTSTGVNMLTVRVNYKFGGPVVARY